MFPIGVLMIYPPASGIECATGKNSNEKLPTLFFLPFSIKIICWLFFNLCSRSLFVINPFVKFEH